MTHAYEQRPARLLGAVSLAVADELRAAGRAVAPHGPSGPAALVALDGGLGGGTIEALRQALGLTHSGTVRLVDRLVTAGLVERRVGPDARSLSLHLTPPGRRAARQVATARDSALQRAIDRIDAGAAQPARGAARAARGRPWTNPRLEG